MSDERSLSKTHVDKAGAALRKWWNDGADIGQLTTDPVLDAAVNTLIEWRASHRMPLVLAQFQLGSAAQEVVEDAVPVGRPKRASQIVYKLVRQPTMRLSQMEDIAGTRVVVPSQPEVAQIVERLLPRSRRRKRSITSRNRRRPATEQSMSSSDSTIASSRYSSGPFARIDGQTRLSGGQIPLATNSRMVGALTISWNTSG